MCFINQGNPELRPFLVGESWFLHFNNFFYWFLKILVVLMGIFSQIGLKETIQYFIEKILKTLIT